MKIKQAIRSVLSSNEAFLFLIILAICIFFGICNPAFFSVANVFDISKSMIETGIFAAGSLVVMISGGLDLSFMAIAVCAMHTVGLYFGMYYKTAPFFLLVLTGMLIGVLLGMFNSIFIVKFQLPAFIVTLGTCNIIKGFCLAFIGSRQVNKIPSSMIAFSKTYLMSVNTADGGRANLHAGVLVLIAVLICTSILLNKTMLGRKIYCIGGNPASVERIGIKCGKVLVFVYAYAGALAGLGGVLHVSYQRMSNPFDLVGGELMVIAAIVIGGPRVGGGYGNVLGTVLGVLLLTMINNSLVMLRIPTFWQKAVVGFIIILGTTVQVYRYKRSRSS